MARATSICPAWPRRAWMAGFSGAVDPIMASVDMADVRIVRAEGLAMGDDAKATAMSAARAEIKGQNAVMAFI